MKRIKIKYTKGDEVKFISHRNLMQVFQRAIRRADLPVVYSQGFNPHMRISWGNALKVGRSSMDERAVVQFEENIKPHEVMAKLNKELPRGIEILEAFLV
ncbi:MAG: TIGR03936 family radical SAM-associated protein [Candidatus Margulisiibacteriota bacterium]|nr:TIGR03936 family radical SAM-associated protein [Candidatus Margulisiibacteriota bacterium]